MPKVHVTRQPCAHTLAKLFARLIPVLCKWCARTSKDSPSGLGDFVGGGGRRARKQPSMGHTLAELAPHVKLENYLEDTSSVYYSPLKTSRPYLAALLRPRVRVRQISDRRTPTRVCARGAWALHTHASHRVCICPRHSARPMHTPRMCCFCEVDAEAAAHWQDPDTVARVLKGWCDARCAGSFCTRASGPRCPIASPALCHKPSALPHSRDAPLITDTHPVTHR